MSIVYSVVQFSFYAQELNSRTKAVLINHISKVNPHVRPRFLTVVASVFKIKKYTLVYN